MPSETFRRQKERILTLYRAFVFQIADCPQNRCRVFGNQAVFDNAVLTRKVHQTFHAQSAQMVGNRCRRHGQGFGQLGNIAIAVQQLEQYRHTFGMRHKFEYGVERYCVHRYS